MKDPSGTSGKRYRLNGKQRAPWSPKTLADVFEVEDVFTTWLMDHDVIRYSGCSRSCKASVTIPGDSNTMIIAHISNPLKHLSRAAAGKLVQKLYLPKLQSIQCTCCRKGICECLDHALSCTRIVIALVQKIRHERLDSNFILQTVQLDSEKLTQELKASKLAFHDVVITLLKVSPRLQGISFSHATRTLNPQKVLEAFTMNDALVPTAKRMAPVNSDENFSIVTGPDMLDAMTCETASDARALGCLHRKMVDLTCMNLFFMFPEDVDEAGFRSAKLVQAFVAGFTGSAAHTPPRIKSLGFCGVDLRTAGHDIAKLCNSLPELNEMMFGERANASSEGTPCLTHSRTFEVLSREASGVVSKLRRLTFRSEVFHRKDEVHRSTSIAPVLRQARSLKTLDLRESNFDDKDATLLSRAGLQALPSLETFIVANCLLYELSGARALGNIITAFGHVSNLDVVGVLTDWPAQEELVLALGPTAAANLRTVHLGGHSPGFELHGSAFDAAMSLPPFLTAARCLRKLVLHEAALGAADLNMLAHSGDLIGHGLQDLILEYCKELKNRRAGFSLAKFISLSVPSLKNLSFYQSATRATLWGMADAISSLDLKLAELRNLHIWDLGQATKTLEHEKPQLMRELKKGCPKLEAIQHDICSSFEGDEDDMATS